MTLPYLAHFALTDAPFSKEIADAELWLPTSRLAVVSRVVEADTRERDHRRGTPRSPS